MRTLTWKLNSAVPAFHRREKVLACLTRACEAWVKAGAGELRLVHFQDGAVADIHFEFGRIRPPAVAERRPVQRKEGGSIRHVIVFDDHHDWNAGGWWNRIFGPGLDLLTHAVHEVGHALGLPHSERELSVMFIAPEASGLKNGPDKEDARELRALLLGREPQSWRS